jgi:hypothetical protein
LKGFVRIFQKSGRAKAGAVSGHPASAVVYQKPKFDDPMKGCAHVRF